MLMAGGLVARLGQGVTILAWLLLVRQVTGSYAQAAAVGATTSAAIALAGPVAGRLADRFGASRVLPYYGAGFAGTQLVLLAAVLAGARLWILLLLAVLSGASFPPLSPALRAAWSALTAPETGRAHARPAALAAESTLFELIFVTGPLVLSAFLLAAARWDPGGGGAISGPAAAIVFASLTTGGGTVLLARGRALAGLHPGSGGPPTRGLGPLRAPGMPVVLVCAVGVAFSFGGAPVAIAAHAQDHDPVSGGSIAGLLIAVWSAGSALAGFAYGARRWVAPLESQFTWLLAGLSLGYLAWLAAPGPVALGGVLFLTGAVIAPALAVQAGLVADRAPPGTLNEAYTWLTTTNLTCAAIGATTTGLVVDRAGAAGGFAAAALAAGMAAALATRLPTRTIRPRAGVPGGE